MLIGEVQSALDINLIWSIGYISLAYPSEEEGVFYSFE